MFVEVKKNTWVNPEKIIVIRKSGEAAGPSLANTEDFVIDLEGEVHVSITKGALVKLGVPEEVEIEKE